MINVFTCKGRFEEKWIEKKEEKKKNYGKVRGFIACEKLSFN